MKAIAIALLCLMFSGCYTTSAVVTYEPIRIHYPHYYWLWDYHPYHYGYGYYYHAPTWVVAPHKPLPPPEHKPRTTGNTRGQRH